MMDQLGNLFVQQTPTMIPLDTCVRAVANVYQQSVTPAAASAAVFALFAMALAIIVLFQSKEKKLMRDFLRREDKLNKYENWKKDRQLIQE